jgi:hypothetical protein
MVATWDWQTSWTTAFARRVAAYNPFRVAILEDAAERIISEFRGDSNA